MKKYLLVFGCLLLALAAGAFLGRPGAAPAPVPLSVHAPGAESTPTPSPAPSPSPSLPAADLAGVWVPYMALTTEKPTAQSFRENFTAIADAARDKGLNALFVHVRPFCDALYPSEEFPWSHLLTGTQGQDPGFDPLAFMVEETHARGMAFHAWVNPLRVKTARTPAVLSPESFYQQMKDEAPYYFMEEGGAVWLNPAWPAVRGLIARGVGEIVENYGVDGVHFDDYFYPSQDPALDGEAYALYTETAEEPLALADWRTANINALVAEVYQAVKSRNPDCLFGISPQGNIANDLAMGADVAAWMAVPGYVDYLCPQLYYSFENPALGYGEALDQWLALPRREGLALYAGLALYKVDSDADQGTWRLGGDEIARQREAARAAQCSGVVLYSSEYLDRYAP